MNLYAHAERAKYCKNGSRHPPSCTKRVATPGKNLKEKPSEEGEARDPDPDLEARQDFWSIVRDCMSRNHVAPRTKVLVPKDEIFPNPLIF